MNEIKSAPEGDDAGDDDAPASEPATGTSAELERPGSARLDELLADPPLGEYHRGRFGGYAEGSRGRRLMVIIGVVTMIALVIGAYVLITYLQSRKPIPIHDAPLPEGTDASGRSRTIAWSSGRARLALTREPPGADVIELPDREIHLAEGCDAAQIKVEVVDGQVKSLKVLYGEVVQVARADP
ncbi:MAG: hypothetical protein R3B09_05525 [Nannocystaceae bacterium]